QLGARHARAQPRRPRLGGAARAPLRDTRRRRAAVRARAHAPAPLPPQLPRRDPGSRLGHSERGRPQALHGGRSEAGLRHRPRRAGGRLGVTAAVFPLIPRRRVIGLAFGGVRSVRRGIGSDVASTREYRPGDDVGWMDWAASAKLSAARGDDQFIVRERFADEAPRVIVLCDRRPSMSIRESPLRRLDKPQAILTALDLIQASAMTARSLTGYLDYADGEPYWRPPRTGARAAPGTFERP